MRRSAPLRTLPRSAFEATLDLLSGRFPSDEFAVTGVKGHETRNGYAYSATVRRNGKVVGRLENEGNGGGTTFYCTVTTPESVDADGNKSWDFSANHAAKAAFDEWVLAWDTSRWDEQMDAFGGGYADDDREGPLYSRIDFVADDLITEYEVAKSLKSAVKKGRTPFLDGSDYPQDGGFSYYSAPLDTRLLAHIVKNHGDDARVWTGDAWVDASEVAL